MKFILAHDLGTSGNKATLFDSDGQLRASEVYSYSTHYFNGSWVEQNPADWWQAICVTSQKLIRSAGIDPADIAVVSFSGQMMGCLCVDRSGTPLRNAIIWADQRAQAQAAAIEARISLSDFYHITGHRNSPSYGVQKLMWVRDNEPEIYRQTYKTLNAKDYIVFRLTGQFYTEPSDATSMTCFDLTGLHWSDTLLEFTGIDPEKLPEVILSTAVAGTVTKQAAEATGLRQGTPVVMGGGDGVCANVGAGSVRPGKAFSYIGSSGWIATTAEKPVFDEQMRTVTWAHIVPGLYAPNGTVQSAGGAYNWLKNEVCRYETEAAGRSGESPYQLMNEEAAQSPVGSNGVLFLPYLMGERAPRWNPSASAAFLGIRMEHRRSDLIRSVMEGVTLNLSIILDILRQHQTIDQLLVMGGGAKGALWRQIMADIYDAKITVPMLLEEATSMGAAVTGGVGVGLFPNFDIIDRFLSVSCEELPNPEAVAAYQPVKQLFDETYEALKPVYKKFTH